MKHSAFVLAISVTSLVILNGCCTTGQCAPRTDQSCPDHRASVDIFDSTTKPRCDASGAARALFIVDDSVYPHIRDGLQRYAAHVKRLHNVTCEALPDDYYGMKPSAIRAILKEQYETSDPPLVGAILVGPIPHACRSHDPNVIMTPCPMYYEDFDAVYTDKDRNGVFSDDEITNNRIKNPTEIWVSWWVPPALTGPDQIAHLQGYLDKLDRYYKHEIVGRGQMLWTAGNVVKVEDVEGWTVLLRDTMAPLEQTLRIWSSIGQDTGTFRPNKRKEEHGPRDFVKAFTLQPWQHAHIIAHGNQRGWYWDNTGVCFARKAGSPPESEYSLLFALDKYDEPIGANIVTTSGCSNGNFRGDYVKEAYDCALPNILLFSPKTLTVAYYGAASPQSTSGFACMVTELIEGLKHDGGSYLAEGYYKLKNHDYSWGLQHYFFRGGDEKVLLGDPFACYRDSQPFSQQQQQDIQAKIDKAKWEITGPW